ncbi:MAG: spore germination protein, partial [Acutalibacteraceae bacterium]|nr:spore germination protein [Acutalibacteraceae bacterium]
MNVNLSLKENIKQIKKLLSVDKSFDIVGRDIDIGNKSGYLLFVDGFAKDEAMIHVMKGLQGVSADDENALELMLKDIPYIETEMQTDLVKSVDAVLSGQVALFVDGEQRAVLIDARQYPSREPSESHIEKVTRGSRDDLVETLVFNTALVRRRLRDRGLTFEITNVGEMSKTDVAIGY